VAISFSTGTCTDGLTQGNTIRRAYAGIYASGSGHKILDNVTETTANYSITGHDFNNGVIENNSCLNVGGTEACYAINLVATAGTISGCRFNNNTATDGGNMDGIYSIAANYQNFTGDSISINDAIYDIVATAGKKVIITIEFNYGYPYCVELDFMVWVGSVPPATYFHRKAICSGSLSNATTLAADSAITNVVDVGNNVAKTAWTGAQAASTDYKLVITYTNGGASTVTGRMKIKALSTYGILSITVANDQT
jgi:hypothetical protein